MQNILDECRYHLDVFLMKNKGNFIDHYCLLGIILHLGPVSHIIFLTNT